MSKKILVADDEKDALLMLKTRLSNAGYEVILAQSGEEAVKKAKEKQPNLIILDIVMQGMDGAEAAKVLEANYLTSSIPIIFLSCLIRKGEEEGVRDQKDRYYMAKPYSPEKLLSVIEERIR